MEEDGRGLFVAMLGKMFVETGEYKVWLVGKRGRRRFKIVQLRR